jgi:8-oxo-dGTP pyrophosphatase MutT (NUDIX family)
VFLVKHGSDTFWKFPGGKMQAQGTFEETAKREAREELGVEVELVGEPVFFVFDRPYQGKKEYVVLCHYAARFDGVIECAQDIKEGMWHPVDALPVDCAPNVPAMVKHFLNPKK